MDNIFQSRALTAAVNLIRPVHTPVLDAVFQKKAGQITPHFAWDVHAASETVLSNITALEAATVADRATYKSITCDAPRFAEKRLISASDLSGMRAFGSQAASELLKERIGREQADMKRKIDLTREFMACKALSGQVLDGEGNVLVDYNFDAAQTPTLTGTDLWTDASSNPIAKIRAWKKQIAQAGYVNKFVAFCGSDAMDALMTHADVLELLKYTQGDQIAEQGRVAQFMGIEIHEIMGSYLDGSAVRQDMIPADHFIMVGISEESFIELFAPVVDLDVATGVGSGVPAEIFHSKSWSAEDPSGRWVKVEARPLPVISRPELILSATVV